MNGGSAAIEACALLFYTITTLVKLTCAHRDTYKNGHCCIACKNENLEAT